MAVTTVTVVQVLKTALVCISLMISSSHVGQSLECKRIHWLQRTMNMEALKLLANMKQIPYSDCQHEQRNFQFPKFLNKRAKVPEVILRSVVYQTKKMYDNDVSKITSDKNTADAIDKLRMLLEKMTQQWSDCLYKQMDTSRPRSPQLPKKKKRIVNYFKSVNKFLKEKDYSPCAWDAVRKEVEKSLRFVTRHTDFLIKGDMQH